MTFQQLSTCLITNAIQGRRHLVRTTTSLKHSVLSVVLFKQKPAGSPARSLNRPKKCPTKKRKSGAKKGAKAPKNQEDESQGSSIQLFGVLLNAYLEQSRRSSLNLRRELPGFGALLDLQMEGFPDRALGMFLTSRVKENPPRIEVGRKQLPITPEAVHKVFGIPKEGGSFPEWKYKELKAGRAELRWICEEKGLKQKYEDEGRNYHKLPKTEVPRWFIESFVNSETREVDDWTAQYFFMLLFNAFFFPTTSDKFGGEHYLMAKDLQKIAKIDWCSEVVKDIMLKSKDWNESIAAEPNSTPCIQGCMAFLVIYYLDNFQCDSAVRTRDLPRCKFFTEQVIKSIVSGDLVGMKYGNLELRPGDDTVYADIRGIALPPVEADEELPVFLAKGGILKNTTDIPHKTRATRDRLLSVQFRTPQLLLISRHRLLMRWVLSLMRPRNLNWRRQLKTTVVLSLMRRATLKCSARSLRKLKQPLRFWKMRFL